MSLINKYLLNTYYLLGTVLITENFKKQKEWKDMFQEKWSKETERELKGREEEEMSEKVTAVTFPNMLIWKMLQHLSLYLPRLSTSICSFISDSQIKAISKA